MHYFGIAVCKDGTTVDELMRPFDENNCLEWTDAHEYEEYEYENGKMDAVRMPDGTLRTRFNDEFAVNEMTESGIMMTRFVIPEGCEEVKAPRKEVFPDYDRYLLDWCGYIEDPELGIGSWDNPRGRYDYYRVGGRWSGGIAATKGDRVERCWEIEDWERHHPGEHWYKERQYDVADVDDMVEGEQHSPSFFVSPDGEWFDREEWGDSGWSWSDESDAEFWSRFIEPLRGKGGYTAYAIDIHD